MRYSTSSLSGFVAPTVAGHSGQILSLTVGDRRIALVAGRVHLYEGNTADQVVHPIRTVIAAGATKVVLTNAAGGIDPIVGTRHRRGDPRPHQPDGDVAPRRPRATQGLRLAVRRPHRSLQCATSCGGEGRHRIWSEGVYGGFRGPHYETPAEIVMARTMGATLVGMSTVLEAIAARHLGAEVLGLSLVSNHAAGVTAGHLNHLEVLEAGQSAAASLGALLTHVIPVL